MLDKMSKRYYSPHVEIVSLCMMHDACIIIDMQLAPRGRREILKNVLTFECVSASQQDELDSRR